MASAVPPGQSSTHGFLNEEDGDDDLPTPPKKGKWTRCHFLQDTWAVDGDVDMVTYSQFLQYICDHLLTLLGIKDLKNIADAKA
ncbi:hypothetical protein EDC04DRAFT_2888941 [Pisolithus marmoratus]|nr:hypothetical protein EDC04DRAFT_2888941 [Pisolithus marmoratus]